MGTQQQLDLDVLAPARDDFDAIADQMLRLFRGGTRRLMAQDDEGGYRPLHDGALTHDDLVRHLCGRVSVGPYLYDSDGCCTYVVVDVDIPKREVPDDSDARNEKKAAEVLPVLARVRDAAIACGVPRSALLLEDTGGRGAHVWFFFESPLAGREAIAFLQGLAARSGVEGLELFPKAPYVAGRFGNLVKLPLGVHRKYGNARSYLLDTDSLQPVSSGAVLASLRAIEWTPAEAVARAAPLASAARAQALATSPEQRQRPRPGDTAAPTTALALRLCPALGELATKARNEGHLLHHERRALGIVLQYCEGGADVVHSVMRCCSDYDEATTAYQLRSLAQYNPLRCTTLQSPRYGRLCMGWCCQELQRLADEGQRPTPVWFAGSRETETDADDVPLIERISSIPNLHAAWLRAKRQASERDVFEDVQAYAAFEAHLHENLAILQHELRSGRWRHGPFQVVLVPKEPLDDSGARAARPMCWASPRDAVVALALLCHPDVGPHIDAQFDRRSLGNRLTKRRQPSGADDQVFHDWRQQNRLREHIRSAFAYRPASYHYLIVDVRQFYEHVAHGRLLGILRDAVGGDEAVLRLAASYLEAEWLVGNARYGQRREGCGLPQGPALSAFLANLYLQSLDHWLDSHCEGFVRYVDDIATLHCSAAAAEGFAQALRAELARLGLELNDGKSKGPASVAEAAPLWDWLTDLRSQAAWELRHVPPATDAEVHEMKVALDVIAGVAQGDLDRMTRYLGFYVSASERLNPKQWQGACQLATHVLTVGCPKDGATRIAVRAWLRLAAERGEQGWQELRCLVDRRPDAYFRVVLAEEARRLLCNRAVEAGPGLVALLASLLESGDLPVLAAALTALEHVEQLTEAALAGASAVAATGHTYVRARALVLLSRSGTVQAATLAIVAPSDGDELALMLHLLRQRHRPDDLCVLAESLSPRLPRARVALPAALAVVLQSGSVDGLRGCAEVMASDSIPEREVAQRTAPALLVSLGRAEAAGAVFPRAIIACTQAGLPLLGRELYAISVAQGVVVPDDVLEGQLRASVEASADVGEARLADPPPVGGTLVRDFDGVFTWHVEADGAAVAIAQRVGPAELGPLGITPTRLHQALAILRQAGLLVVDSLELLEASDSVEAHSGFAADLVCLAAGAGGGACRDAVLATIEEVAGLLARSTDHLRGGGHGAGCAPVPSLHSIALGPGGQPCFRGEVLDGYAGARRYRGRNGATYRLSARSWRVQSLALLLVELLCPDLCAASLVGAESDLRALSSRIGELPGGAGLAAIVRKALSRDADEGYPSAGLFVEDLKAWHGYEQCCRRAELSQADHDMVSRLVAVEIGLRRMAHDLIGRRTPAMEAVAALGERTARALFEEDTLRKGLMAHVTLRRGGVGRPEHVATQQLRGMARWYRRVWDTTEAADWPAGWGWQWLDALGCLLEIEALDRSLDLLGRDALREEANTAFMRVIDSSTVVHSAPETELSDCLNKYAPQLSDRSAVWGWGRGQPRLPVDLLLMAAMPRWEADGRSVLDPDVVRTFVRAHDLGAASVPWHPADDPQPWSDLAAALQRAADVATRLIPAERFCGYFHDDHALGMVSETTLSVARATDGSDAVPIAFAPNRSLRYPRLGSRHCRAAVSADLPGRLPDHAGNGDAPRASSFSLPPVAGEGDRPAEWVDEPAVGSRPRRACGDLRLWAKAACSWTAVMPVSAVGLVLVAWIAALPWVDATYPEGSAKAAWLVNAFVLPVGWTGTALWLYARSVARRFRSLAGAAPDDRR